MITRTVAESLTIITTIAEPIVKSMALELWGIEIFESGRSVIRIFVDIAPENSADKRSIDVDECAEISRHIALALEVEELFSSAYRLEVSSPGLSRPLFKLEQLPPYIGQTAEFMLKEPLDDSGRKKFQGVLYAIENDIVTLNIAASGKEEDKELISLPWGAVHKARRVHIFAEKVKPGHKKSAG